jgi:hypothetical protein
MNDPRLIRVSAPHFVAGAVLNDRDIVVFTAPIISYMKGWTSDKVRQYCERKGWIFGRAKEDRA